MLLLLGPFVDSEHPGVLSGGGTGDRTVDCLMREEVLQRLAGWRSNHPAAVVAMMPAVRDMTALPVLPQPAMTAAVQALGPPDKVGYSVVTIPPSKVLTEVVATSRMNVEVSSTWMSANNNTTKTLVVVGLLSAGFTGCGTAEPIHGGAGPAGGGGLLFRCAQKFERQRAQQGAAGDCSRKTASAGKPRAGAAEVGYRVRDEGVEVVAARWMGCTLCLHM